jgi:hypothetical protein
MRAKLHLGSALAVALSLFISTITPAQAVTQLPPNAIIVDDGDAGFQRFGTDSFWRVSTDTSSFNFFNGDVTWTSNYSRTVDNHARWSLPLNATLPMTYEVFVFVPRYNSTTTNAVYTISRGGSTTTQSINQSNYYAEWVSLGKHVFNNAGANHVMLTDATGEPDNTKRVGFDAVAFVPQTPVTPPPPAFTATAFVHMPIITGGKGGGVVDNINAPPATTSRYISTIDPARHYNMGCETGRRGESGMLVLAFGQPWTVGLGYGASIYSSFYPASTSQVAEAAKGFLRGFADCSSTQTLQVGLGVNNYKGETNANHGRAWGQMVNSVHEWLSGQPFANRISVAGATDAEPSWNTRENTRAWVDGFVNATDRPLINFGSCDGCPTALNPTQQPNNGWTVDDVWYISAGARNTLALPEIYLTGGVHADQWYRVSLHGYIVHGKRIPFAGTLTQYAACQERGCNGTDNTPARGWSQLNTAVNLDIRTATTISFSSDITWRQDDDSFSALRTKPVQPFTAPLIAHQAAGEGYLIEDVQPPLPAMRFIGSNVWVGRDAHAYAGLIRSFDGEGNESAAGGLALFPMVNGEITGDAVFYPAPNAAGAVRIIAAEGNVLIVQGDAGVLRFDVTMREWQ